MRRKAMLHEGTSFPVGKIAFLDLYPLDYEEFLIALGENQLEQLLVSRDFSLIIHIIQNLLMFIIRTWSASYSVRLFTEFNNPTKKHG